MYISNFEITNYKSYREPAALKLGQGFNIITGQNSAGKTALLEALTLQIGHNPHRSLRTMPTRTTVLTNDSSVRVLFAINREEFLSFFRPGVHYYFPRPKNAFITAHGGDGNGFMDWLFRQQEVRIAARLYKSSDGTETWRGDSDHLEVFGFYETDIPPRDNRYCFQVRFDSGEHPHVVSEAPVHQTNDVRAYIASQLRPRIYRFTAERFNIGQCQFGNNSVLATNAQNLPEVLDVLTANTDRFRELNELVREVLPQIEHVSLLPLDGNRVQIRVWPHDLRSQRQDLAIPLNECGSGVGQVLAILYVVMASYDPQVIIIDEPQSFLHPGAVRRLLGVLKRYPQHQYILATHSPTVITASDPTTVTITKLSEGETTLQELNPTDTKDLQFYLAEIGARLADVFGADDILWVEGQTEERCFPLILKTIAKHPLMGTAIVGIRQTGDLESRDAKRVLEIYGRLSKGTTLLPPAVAVILDQECRRKEDMTELQKLGEGLKIPVQFLPRRMYENYLLSPTAIAVVTSRIEGFHTRSIAEGEVAALIDGKRQNVAYFCRGTTQVPTDWETGIDGARVLEEVFQELSENRVSYDKIKHSTAITEWLIQNNADQLMEIAGMLIKLLAREVPGSAAAAH
jgi:predicted ATPase